MGKFLLGLCLGATVFLGITVAFWIYAARKTGENW